MGKGGGALSYGATDSPDKPQCSWWDLNITRLGRGPCCQGSAAGHFTICFDFPASGQPEGSQGKDEPGARATTGSPALSRFPDTVSLDALAVSKFPPSQNNPSRYL